VRLRGLKAKPQLNGQEGTVREHKADTGRWTVKLADGTDFAVKASNIEVLHPGYGSQASSSAVSDTNVLEGFDRLVSSLESTRQSVFDAMAYCMEHAAQHAAPLAQRLARALGKPGIGTKAYVARLFLVSDMLHNSRGTCSGASELGAGLQEMLPETCEKLGRVWLRRIEGQEERAGAEDTVRQVLGAWQEWNMFPPLFTKGLESLLFAQVFDISAKEAGGEPDGRLRQKLTRWFAGLNQSQLPNACQQRGLAGKALPMATCRARLCHFERYWHLRVGCNVRLHGLLSAPYLNGMAGTCEQWDLAAARWQVRLEDGAVKAVRQDNLVLEEAVSSQASNGATGVRPSTGSADGVRDDSSIDGEPLTDEELAELSSMEVDTSDRDDGCSLQRGYGVWTQVAEQGARCLVAPADYDSCSEKGMGRP